MLSRNFPLSSDSSIHLPELGPQLWAAFALAPSPCEPPGAVSSEAQPRASQLGRAQGGEATSRAGAAGSSQSAGRGWEARGSGQLPQRPLAAPGCPSPPQPSNTTPTPRPCAGEPKPPRHLRSIKEYLDESLERAQGLMGAKLLLTLRAPHTSPWPWL